MKFIKLINFPQLGSEEEEEEEVGERVKEKEEKISMLSALIKIYKKLIMLYEDGLWLSQGLYAKAYQSTNLLP